MTYYNIGLASVPNGGKTVTFSGAGLGSKEFPFIKPGELFLDPAQPLVAGQRLASVDYETQTAELWVGWPGLSMVSAPYEIRLVDDAVRSSRQSRRYIEMAGQLTALGLQPTAFGEFADRAAYDDAAKGFLFLSLDGDGETDVWTLYMKVSAASADWSDGQKVEGTPGAANTLTIGTVTSGPAAATITGTAPNQTLNLVLQPGADSTVPGPANSLTIGTVESGPAADATITGEAPEQVLNLVLPQGPAAPTGKTIAMAMVFGG